MCPPKSVQRGRNQHRQHPREQANPDEVEAPKGRASGGSKKTEGRNHQQNDNQHLHAEPTFPQSGHFLPAGMPFFGAAFLVVFFAAISPYQSLPSSFRHQSLTWAASV